MSVSLNEIDRVKNFVRNGSLNSDVPFMIEKDSVIQANVNGCGAQNAKFDFVPDTLLGLRIKDCCIIHDWDYFCGSRIEDKERADRRFRNNMLRKLKAVKGWQKVLKIPRRTMIQFYYGMVDKFGGPAFWDGKSNGP